MKKHIKVNSDVRQKNRDDNESPVQDLSHPGNATFDIHNSANLTVASQDEQHSLRANTLVAASSHSYRHLPSGLPSTMCKIQTPYLFPFDYGTRPLMPPMPESIAVEHGYLTGFKDGTSYPTPPPHFPGPFPYGLPFASNEKQLGPYLPCVSSSGVEVHGKEDQTAHVDISNSTRSLQPILPPAPSHQMPPPFPIFPPPPGAAGQYYPPRFIAPRNELGPLTIDARLHDVHGHRYDYYGNSSINIGRAEPENREATCNADDAESSFSTNASPAPSAMLSPQTSKLLQSAIGSETDSIMALSPGTEHYQDESVMFATNQPEKRLARGAYRDIVDRSLSQYEPNIAINANKMMLSKTNFTEIKDKSSHHTVQPYINETSPQFDRPSCKYASVSRVTPIPKSVASTDLQDDTSEDESDDDDEEDDDTGSDTSSNAGETIDNDEDYDEEMDSLDSDKSTNSSEIDVDKDIQRVDSPFTRIRPSLLKSYRDSKKYKEAMELKKSRKLDQIVENIAPESPCPEIPDAPEPSPMLPGKQDMKIQTSGLESEEGDSTSSDEVESEPRTPYTPGSLGAPRSVDTAKDPGSIASIPHTPGSYIAPKSVDIPTQGPYTPGSYAAPRSVDIAVDFALPPTPSSIKEVAVPSIENNHQENREGTDKVILSCGKNNNLVAENKDLAPLEKKTVKSLPGMHEVARQINQNAKNLTSSENKSKSTRSLLKPNILSLPTSLYWNTNLILPSNDHTSSSYSNMVESGNNHTSHEYICLNDRQISKITPVPSSQAEKAKKLTLTQKKEFSVATTSISNNFQTTNESPNISEAKSAHVTLKRFSDDPDKSKQIKSQLKSPITVFSAPPRSKPIVTTTTVISVSSSQPSIVSSKSSSTVSSISKSSSTVSSISNSETSQTTELSKSENERIISTKPITTIAVTKEKTTHAKTAPDDHVLLPIAEIEPGTFAIIIKPFAKGVAQLKSATNKTEKTNFTSSRSKSEVPISEPNSNKSMVSLLSTVNAPLISIKKTVNNTTKTNNGKRTNPETTGTTSQDKVIQENEETPQPRLKRRAKQEKRGLATSGDKIKILPKPQHPSANIPSYTSIEKESVMLNKPLQDGPAITQGFYCVDCNKMYPAGCTEHSTQYSRVDDVGPFTKARYSVPDQLALKTMYNQNSPDFIGVISKCFIPYKTQFGPLQGLRTSRDKLHNPENTAYVWEVFDEAEPNMVLDCRDENESNWLMFVKRARSSVEQNMNVYQQGRDIYFISIKDIQPATELLYWYAMDYARMLGVCTKPEENFRCPSCHKEFADMQTLRAHSKEVHKHLAKCKQECKQCGKLFVNASKLADHMDVHTGEKKHACVQCGARFNDRSNLNRHMKLHSGNARKYACNMCNKRFSQKEHLRTHLVTHSESRDHHCRFCEASFRRRADLRMHEKSVHCLGESFACTHKGCDKVFYKRDNLKKHALVHNGLKQFECEICNTKFKQKGHLKTHMQRIHDKKIMNENTIKLRNGVT